MTRTIIILFILAGLTNSYSQDLDGVWMSYHDGVINHEKSQESILEGFIIDFDKNQMRHMSKDTILPIKVNYKKKRIRIPLVKLKVRFKVFESDSLSIGPKGKESIIYRKLDLDHKLSISKTELINHMSTHKFEPLNDFMDIEFSDEQYFFDKMLGKSIDKRNLINNTWSDSGYWFVKEIQQNYFLIFTLNQTDKPSIYQILSISNEKIILDPLQETDFGLKNITQLKSYL